MDTASGLGLVGLHEFLVEADLSSTTALPSLTLHLRRVVRLLWGKQKTTTKQNETKIDSVSPSNSDPLLFLPGSFVLARSPTSGFCDSDRVGDLREHAARHSPTQQPRLNGMQARVAGGAGSTKPLGPFATVASEIKAQLWWRLSTATGSRLRGLSGKSDARAADSRTSPAGVSCRSRWPALIGAPSNLHRTSIGEIAATADC